MFSAACPVILSYKSENNSVTIKRFVEVKTIWASRPFLSQMCHWLPQLIIRFRKALMAMFRKLAKNKRAALPPAMKSCHHRSIWTGCGIRCVILTLIPPMGINKTSLPPSSPLPLLLQDLFVLLYAMGWFRLLEPLCILSDVKHEHLVVKELDLSLENSKSSFGMMLWHFQPPL